MPSICLVYGFVVALGGLQPFLVQGSRFEVRRSMFSFRPQPQMQESRPVVALINHANLGLGGHAGIFG
jgi:hypothetical protein